MSAFATITLSKSGHQRVPKHLDPESKGFDYGFNLARWGIPGNHLPDSPETFDNVAKTRGVTPLASFLDYSEIDNECRAADGLPPLESNWFSIEEGLKTIEALLDEFSWRGFDEGLLWDLQVSQAILKAAMCSGENFHFSVS